jgi:GTPase SAR1 family protein
MDITMIGLQNAGKTSLLRVLAVSTFHLEMKPRCVHNISANIPTDETLSREENSLLSASIPAQGCASSKLPTAQLCATMSSIVTAWSKR